MLRSTQGDADNPNHHVVQVAVGSKHALLLTDEGIVYSWGCDNDFSQLGRAIADNMQKPTPITETFRIADKDPGSGKLEVIVQIACGLNHCLALSQNGKLYSWGNNKAGQLGHAGYVPDKPASKKCGSPTLVCGFDGSPESAVVKSCSCGPESSACVTTNGEIYVWGANSFYMFGEGRLYKQGENCTIPVKLRGVPSSPPTLSLTGQPLIPDRLALYKNRVVSTIASRRCLDDIAELLESRKARANLVASITRQQRQENKGRSGDLDRDGGDDDLRQLNDAMREQQEKLAYEIKEKTTKLMMNKEELRRVTRDLTICDQQDTAYNETASVLEVKKSEGAEGKKQTHLIDSQLNDINQFRSSNRRNKLQHLAQRDALEQEAWKLQQELATATQAKALADARAKLLHQLQKGERDKGGNSTVDDGLRIASSKREELAATYPQTLAGVGRFSGFQEVLMISDRALQDVSSALTEVSAVATGGDGAVLEEVLEANLKLRKEYNTQISEKLSRVEDITGMLRVFFDEVKKEYVTEELKTSLW
jgi:hypothetical protein